MCVCIHVYTHIHIYVCYNYEIIPINILFKIDHFWNVIFSHVKMSSQEF